MNRVSLIGSWINYRWKALGPHGVHSPFIFGLVNEVLQGNELFYCFEEIETCRRSMLQSDKIIQVNDMGAGSRIFKDRTRPVSGIARTALSPPRYSQMIFRLARYCGCQKALELGTSLGITSAYLSHACKEVHTIEADEQTIGLARQNWDALQRTNIRSCLQDFESALDQLLAAGDRFDFVFIDGDHRLDSTLHYLRKLIPMLSTQSVVVFDDIRWSDEMLEAWQQAKALEEFQLSVDLFKMGLLFKRPGVPKQDFTLRF